MGLSRKAVLFVVFVVLGLVAPLLVVSPAAAHGPAGQAPVRFTVDNPADIGDANPGDGRCEIGTLKAVIPTPTLPGGGGGGVGGPVSGKLPTLYPPIKPPEPVESEGRCTLRAAVEEANARTERPHVVTLPSSLGVYHLTEGELPVHGHLTVVRDYSPGSKRAAINAGHRSRIFNLWEQDAHLVVDGLFLAQGSSGNVDGGAIAVRRGELELIRSVLVNNRGNNGGAVAAWGGTRVQATLTSFETNHAAKRGGGIRSSGYLHLDRVSIYKNQANVGGGIYLSSRTGEGFWMANSSVLNNSATERAGGIYAGSESFGGMIHATVSGNAAPEAGGYYHVWDREPLVFADSILAGNIDTENPNGRDASPDCVGEVSTDKVNLFGAVNGFGSGAVACWGYDVGEDLVGTVNRPIDPWLEPVRISTDASPREGGGELAYMRPSFRSPALDVAPNGDCITDDDMRRIGARRNEPCDLGAVER